MKHRLFGLAPALLALIATSATAGCGLFGGDELLITYDLEAQEFVQDFGNQSGTVPDVPCLQNASACSALPVPAGSTASCEAASGRCIVTADVRLTQTINLSSQKTFPSAVTNSGVVQYVKVNAISYWGQNGLTFDTPPLDLFIGAQTVQRETDAGAVKLGTVPSLPANKLTQCKSGAPATKESACQVQLTENGRNVLGELARDFRTPFNVIVVAHVVLHAGDPLPGGKLDVWVQPQLAFALAP